jgi:chemosensory pili system protein ChpA (sensor histidine kinase/response regulator)
MGLQDEGIDFTTLTWVKPELDETLKQARNALQSYVEEGESPAELRACSDLLHQVQGTLRMVELYGAAMVAEEMEQLGRALIDGKVDKRDDAYAVLMQGIVQLPDYLERLQGGHRDIPIVLLPLLNQLRASRGEQSLNESALFSPDLSRPMPDSARGPSVPLEHGELTRRAEALRGLYQGALLRWLKDDNSAATIRDLTDVCEQLVPITSAESARRLFWVAAGTLDALGRNAFPVSNPLKQALAKVEREIKRLADGGDAAFRQDPPIELTKQLLYFVAHEGSDAGRIGEIRQVFGLSGSEPTESELAHARGSLSGNNRALLETVAVAIKDDLLRVKDSLDLHMRTPGASRADLAQQVEALDRVADTLGMLGLSVPRRVVQDQRSAINDVVGGQRRDDEATLLDIAGALLYVEAALDDQVERLGKEERAGGDGSDSNESRRLLEVLVKEAIVNFSQARAAFVGFVETHWDHAQLNDVPRLLAEVAGALRILNVPLPADYLVGVRQFTEKELLQRKHVPTGQQMDRLADALASLEYFLEALRDRRPNRDQILEVARQSLSALGYWPLSADMRASTPMVSEAPRVAPARASAPTPVAMPAASTEATATAMPSATSRAEPAPTPASAAPPTVAAPGVAPIVAQVARSPGMAHSMEFGVPVPGFDAASSEEIDDEIREVFLEEFEEEIDNLAQLLPTWREDPDSAESLRPIRRVFHTLKGSGRLVGARDLGEFSWKVESLLNRVLDGSRPASPEVLALVDLAFEHLPLLRAALQGHAVEADLEGVQATAELLASGEEATYAASAAPAVEEDDDAFEPEPAVATAVAEAPSLADAADIDGPVFSIDPVLFEILKPEVAGHLDVVDAWLADCAARGPQPVSEPLLRSIHTMNGAFGMTDVGTITEVTAPLEGFVKRSLAHHVTPSPDAVALIADASRAIRETVVAIERPHPVLPHFAALASRAVALRDSLPDSLLSSVPVHVEDEPTGIPQIVVMEAADTSALPEFTIDAPVAEASETIPAAEPGFDGEADAEPQALDTTGLLALDADAEAMFAAEAEAEASASDAQSVAVHRVDVDRADVDGADASSAEREFEPTDLAQDSQLEDELAVAAPAEPELAMAAEYFSGDAPATLDGASPGITPQQIADLEFAQETMSGDEGDAVASLEITTQEIAELEFAQEAVSQGEGDAVASLEITPQEIAELEFAHDTAAQDEDGVVAEAHAITPQEIGALEFAQDTAAQDEDGAIVEAHAITPQEIGALEFAQEDRAQGDVAHAGAAPAEATVVEDGAIEVAAVEDVTVEDDATVDFAELPEDQLLSIVDFLREAGEQAAREAAAAEAAEKAAAEAAAAEAAAAQKAAADAAAAEKAAAEAAAMEAAAAEQAAAEAAAEQAAAAQRAADAAAAEAAATESAAAEAAAAEQAAADAAAEQAAADAVAAESAAAESAAAESAAAESAAAESAAASGLAADDAQEPLHVFSGNEFEFDDATPSIAGDAGEAGGEPNASAFDASEFFDPATMLAANIEPEVLAETLDPIAFDDELPVGDTAVAVAGMSDDALASMIAAYEAAPAMPSEAQGQDEGQDEGQDQVQGFVPTEEFNSDFEQAATAAFEPTSDDSVPTLVSVGDEYYGMSLDELEALTAPGVVAAAAQVESGHDAGASAERGQDVTAEFEVVHADASHADLEQAAAGSTVLESDDADSVVDDADLSDLAAIDAGIVPVEADGFADLPSIGQFPAWAAELAAPDFDPAVEAAAAAAAIPQAMADPEDPQAEAPVQVPVAEQVAEAIAADDAFDDAGTPTDRAGAIDTGALLAAETDAEPEPVADVDAAPEAGLVAADYFAEVPEHVAAEATLDDDANLVFADDEDEAEADTVAPAPAPLAEAAAQVARPNVPLSQDPADPDLDLDMSDLDPELLDLFLEETNDILDHSDGMLARLREQTTDRDAVVTLQRDLHTLKGGARMAGIYAVGELGHAMESLLESAAEGRQALDATGVVVLERGFDRLHGMVARIGERKAIAVPLGLIAQVEALSEGRSIDDPGTARADAAGHAEGLADASAAVTPRPVQAPSRPLSAPMDDLGEDEMTGVRAPQEQVRIRADLLDRLVNYAGEVAIYRARLEQQLGAFRANLGELDQTTTRLREQLRRLDIETEAQIVARYQREGEDKDANFDPLELDRFTNQQQLTRALNESANDLVNLQGSLDDLTRQYETLLLQQSRVSSDLQEGLMRTRMVPFDALVPRLRRVLRQAATDTGKQVQLKVDGAGGEMDRNVLERMTAPLEHMLRNAMAHGLELPEERRRARKPEEGTVRIAVQREGSEVVLKVSDDGMGLDKNAIRAKAIERGLIKADAELSDQALYGLILETGFSTAQTVSRLSGRGVGMDVVYSEIRQLGGTLQIRSDQGRGSEFIIRLPFTLAVTQAVFVKIGDTSFAVPIASVQGVGRISRDELDKQIASGSPVFQYAGEDYAIHDLGNLIGHAPAKAQDSLQMPLLLARSGDLRSAISIDQVLGSREIVVKPVGPQVNSVPGIFGATIMGDGRVVVILDVAPLVRRQGVVDRAAAADLAAGVPAAPAAAPAPAARRVPVVMVVDDSITMRKVTGRVLERNNMEVLTAKDGVDAVEKMAERVPDLVLLDIEMPRMDGYEVAQNMRSDPRLKDVPIIMITSRTGEKHRQRAMDIGVNRYLGKPYQEPELMRNVFEMLGIELERADV